VHPHRTDHLSDGFGSLLEPDGTISVDRTKLPVQLQDAMAALAS
jgi:hypothetical protein